ncbi:hypothetical protein BDA96_09G033800 [Sorghum bicolor]|uniref:Uncharacterized protein n=1 Tax=Sorghum bicolor TaxID=4558 RepID=A0A921U3N0_SORBI|nr:hypothetical protein BDA96_09G033800 [Sorghum bicolor]
MMTLWTTKTLDPTLLRTASVITRWQKCSAWFQSTTISTKWRHSPSRQLKLSPKLQMDPDYEHKLAWSHHPSL